MRAVDTNVLVRLLARDDPRHVASAEAFVEPVAWVSHLVLVETMWVLRGVYKRTPAQCAAAIVLMLEHNSLALQDADVVAAAVSQYRRKPNLGFSDCLVLEVARKAGHLPLGTFDRSLSSIEGAQKLA